MTWRRVWCRLSGRRALNQGASGSGLGRVQGTGREAHEPRRSPARSHLLGPAQDLGQGLPRSILKPASCALHRLLRYAAAPRAVHDGVRPDPLDLAHAPSITPPRQSGSPSSARRAWSSERSLHRETQDHLVDVERLQETARSWSSSTALPSRHRSKTVSSRRVTERARHPLLSLGTGRPYPTAARSNSSARSIDARLGQLPGTGAPTQVTSATDHQRHVASGRALQMDPVRGPAEGGLRRSPQTYRDGRPAGTAERSGYADVVTYLVSGNALFTTSSGGPTASLAADIEERHHGELEMVVRVIVRTAGELAAVMAENLLGVEPENPSRFFVGFLSATPATSVARSVEGELRARAPEGDAIFRAAPRRSSGAPGASRCWTTPPRSRNSSAWR